MPTAGTSATPLPIPNAELMQTVLTIETDEGVTGHYFGGGSHGDQEGLNVVDQQLIRRPHPDLLVGQDPLDREMIWKWMWVANIPENVAQRHRQRALGPRRPGVRDCRSTS